MDAEHIDKLLERYLHLLHEYTSLREQLSSLQTGMYQNIARANFAAERGMRFGQDYYDERMQASKRVGIIMDDNQEVPIFNIATRDLESKSPPSSTTDPSGLEKRATEDKNAQNIDHKKGDKDSNASHKKQKDPLRWFGLLTPMPIRQAQAQSIEAVEQVIPKLVSVNTQMAQVEIEVRRARKKRAKAEAAAAAVTQKEQELGVSTEITAQ
ncbi:hypothetical protein F4819DRAFT_464437 [Hypoxylon fuscum]|nr:hypothetical protein F4819DRAFT_464437 [Hypoxylon fuscum]